ncbi:chorismate lyase [Aquincola tertiaricarbonis]|uniref:Probable chorismate pyruvate-lyase n=1 Tax=Aquincola tertiaricarbonis TaxID=391953 RepID=A0ABY4SAZ8_AQUTE|nr:chorismate lyase [Aquincola tertiaricarbonis]URI08913.1 chorismate lyase [Aquincola tertiaricarbonis]
MTPTARQQARHWQRAPGSLTQRLFAWGGEVRVQRLRQQVAPLLPGEAADLGLAPGTRCLVREVVLHVGDAPVVWARSVAPHAALSGPWKALVGLGTRPLAALLFDDPAVSRTPLRPQWHPRGSRWHQRADEAWRTVAGQPWPASVVAARSSVFWRRGMPLRVFEAFSPAMLASPTATPPTSPRPR